MQSERSGLCICTSAWWSAVSWYGTTLKLPGQMVAPSRSTTLLNPSSYVHRLQEHMPSTLPVTTRSQRTTTQVLRGLMNCIHVFIQCDAVRKPLQPPYSGPFRVIRWTPKCFSIDIQGKRESASFDGLKEADREGDLFN